MSRGARRTSSGVIGVLLLLGRETSLQEALMTGTSFGGKFVIGERPLDPGGFGMFSQLVQKQLSQKRLAAKHSQYFFKHFERLQEQGFPAADVLLMQGSEDRSVDSVAYPFGLFGSLGLTEMVALSCSTSSGYSSTSSGQSIVCKSKLSSKESDSPLQPQVGTSGNTSKHRQPTG